MLTSSNIIHDDLLLEMVADLLSEGREARFTMQGNSMSPTIMSGETIIISPAKAESLAPGNIGFYLSDLPTGGQGMVVHRLARRLPSGQYEFKGDSCPLPDQPVFPEQIIGTVCHVERGGKRVVLQESCSSCKSNSFANSTMGLLASMLGTVSVPYLPVSSGRLLRERDLIQLALGNDEVIDELLDSGEQLRIFTDEHELLPAITYHLQAAEDNICRFLPTNPDSLARDCERKISQAEKSFAWLDNILGKTGDEMLLSKGAAMAWGYYPSPECRPPSDIDVLVRPDRVGEVISRLLASGCSLAETGFTISECLRFRNGIRLNLPGHDLQQVDIHWRGGGSPYYNRRADVLRYWQNTRPSEFGDRIRLMTSEAQFIYMATHLARHLPNLRLIWAVDMASLLSRGKLNWTHIAKWSREEGLSLPVAIISRWVNDHIPNAVPVEYLKSISETAEKTSGSVERIMLFQKDNIIAHIQEACSQSNFRNSIANLVRLFLPTERALRKQFPQSRKSGAWRLHAMRFRKLLSRKK